MIDIISAIIRLEAQYRHRIQIRYYYDIAHYRFSVHIETFLRIKHKNGW